MVKQKKRLRITQSVKNCAIQGARLIWKQKIWLVLTKPYFLVANQKRKLNYYFCNELTFLHCTALSQSEWRKFSCVLFAWLFPFFAVLLHVRAHY